MHSFMLVRHGQVVAEGWWVPYAADKTHAIYSLTKSFTSTAVGLAVAEGRLSLEDKVLKFFPAEASGGVAWLKSVGAPLPDAKFCPTGGIDPKNVAAYLGCTNVIAVGGSWVAPKDAIAAGDWSRITRLAQEASALRKAA